jgi:hypothetical protein
MDNYTDTIHAQFANSPTIVGLIDCFNQWIDPSIDLDNFYNTIWNIDTATGYGLDVWGKIVDVSRNLLIPVSSTYLGFDEAYDSGTMLTGIQPFDISPFYTGDIATQIYPLEDDAYRKLIMVKAMANISSCTAPNLNRLLSYLFSGRGKVYVKDLGGMAMQIFIGFLLTDVEKGILLYSGAIPRPAGVSVTLAYADLSTTFGFSGSDGQPFGQGTFLS